LACAPAHSAAIYTWVPGIGANQTVSGEIRISDEAYFLGRVVWDNMSAPSSPDAVEYVYMEAQLPYTRDGMPDAAYVDAVVRPPDGGSHSWSFDFRIVGDGLFGIIQFNNTVDYFGLSSPDSALLWRIESAGTEQAPHPYPCSAVDEIPCPDAVGRWQLVSAPAHPVPEPSSFWLILIGGVILALTALLSARRT
jgi:hypothetical protein